MVIMISYTSTIDVKCTVSVYVITVQYTTTTSSNNNLQCNNMLLKLFVDDVKYN